MVHTDQLELGGVVAFISAVGRLNDPWGDLVNYFRDLNVSLVRFGLVADWVNQLADRWTSFPTDRGDKCDDPAQLELVGVHHPASDQQRAMTCRWLQMFIRKFIENFSLKIPILSCITRSTRFPSDRS